MRTRIFTGRLRRVALLGTLGATLAFLAVPFLGASGASAYPGFTVSVTCTATNGQSGSKAIWDWMQGGTGGTILASGTVWCPAITGSGTSSATGSGIQPASADTLSFMVDVVASNGCGGTGIKDISFTPTPTGTNGMICLKPPLSVGCGFMMPGTPPPLCCLPRALISAS